MGRDFRITSDLMSLMKRDTAVTEHAFFNFLKNLIREHFMQFSSSNFTEYHPKSATDNLVPSGCTVKGQFLRGSRVIHICIICDPEALGLVT